MTNQQKQESCQTPGKWFSRSPPVGWVIGSAIAAGYGISNLIRSGVHFLKNLNKIRIKFFPI